MRGIAGVKRVDRGEMDDPREELCVQNKEGMCLRREGGDG